MITSLKRWAASWVTADPAPNPPSSSTWVKQTGPKPHLQALRRNTRSRTKRRDRGESPLCYARSLVNSSDLLSVDHRRSGDHRVCRAHQPSPRRCTSTLTSSMSDISSRLTGHWLLAQVLHLWTHMKVITSSPSAAMKEATMATLGSGRSSLPTSLPSLPLALLNQFALSGSSSLLTIRRW